MVYGLSFDFDRNDNTFAKCDVSSLNLFWMQNVRLIVNNRQITNLHKNVIKIFLDKKQHILEGELRTFWTKSSGLVSEDWSKYSRS